MGVLQSKSPVLKNDSLILKTQPCIPNNEPCIYKCRTFTRKSQPFYCKSRSCILDSLSCYTKPQPPDRQTEPLIFKTLNDYCVSLSRYWCVYRMISISIHGKGIWIG